MTARTLLRTLALFLLAVLLPCLAPSVQAQNASQDAPGPTADNTPLKPATLIPQWSPQAQFAGYYVALEKGFYRQAGIDMTILKGGPDDPVSKALGSGEADFGTMFLSSAIHLRSNLKLVNVGQVAQRSALMLVGRKSAGIHTLEDLNGRKVGLWSGEFEIQPRALFKNRGLNVTIVPQTSSMTLFLRGAVPAAVVMWYNEYHTLLASGLDPEDIQPFFFHELELNFPEDGIYCLESTFQRDPDLAHAVFRASMQGWLYAFDHPDEALDIVLKYMAEARLPASRVHQQWMLARMKDIILVSDGPLGILNRKTYNQMVQTLFDMDFIHSAPMYETFYKGVPYEQ